MTFRSDVPRLTFSAPESTRFNLRVFRSLDFSFDDAMPLAMIENDCDVVIIRTDAGLQEARGPQYFGFPLRHADTLVYYDCEPMRVEPKPRHNTDLVIRAATSRDMRSLAPVVKRAFTGYKSHYASNELFTADLILEGYIEWAMNFIDASHRVVLLAERADQVIGFLTLEERQNCIEIVLNGVDPKWARRGIYADLVRAVLEKARSSGVERVLVSTQVHNYSVQRVWHREGLRLSSAVQTFHINSMLHAGHEFAVLHLPATSRLADLSARAVLLALDAEMPDASGRVSRIETVLLNSRTPHGSCRVPLRMHVTPSGLRRCVGVIRDQLETIVGILHMDLSSDEREHGPQ